MRTTQHHQSHAHTETQIFRHRQSCAPASWISLQRCHRIKRSISVVAAAADASQAATPAPRQPIKSGIQALLGCLPDRQSLQLVSDAWTLLHNNLWAVVIIFLAKDAAAFVLHRMVHRLTNHIAEVLFNIPISTLGNPWWIMVDAKFMEGHVGYQLLVGVFFLLCLPLNILFNTAAVSTAAVVCVNRQAALSRSALPTASFTGQGRGKVGLADYPRPPSIHSSLDEAAGSSSSGSSLDSTLANAAASTSTTTSSSNSSVPAAAARKGVGVVSFRSGAAGATASFAGVLRAVGAAQHKGTSQKPTQNDSSSSSSSSGVLQQPAAAPALPWLTVVQERSKPPPFLGLKPSIAAVKEAWRHQVAPRIKQLWLVDVLFNAWALPLQGASLAVLPVFWTFPRLLGIQLALPAAVLGGAQGNAALQQSRKMMEGFRSSYAWPFVWLIAGARGLEVLREVVLLAIPGRWWAEVVEVPLVATALFFVVRLLLMRLQDLMPLAAYLMLAKQQPRET